ERPTAGPRLPVENQARSQVASARHHTSHSPIIRPPADLYIVTASQHHDASRVSFDVAYDIELFCQVTPDQLDVAESVNVLIDVEGSVDADLAMKEPREADAGVPDTERGGRRLAQPPNVSNHNKVDGVVRRAHSEVAKGSD